MGKIKGHIQEWLETYGYDLGYDMDNLPPMSEMDEFCPPATEMFYCGPDEPTDDELDVIELELLDNNPDDGSWAGR